MQWQKNSMLVPRILCFLAAIWVSALGAWWLGPWGPESSWLIPFWFPGLSVLALLGFYLQRWPFLQRSQSLPRLNALRARGARTESQDKRSIPTTAEWREKKAKQAQRQRSTWLKLGVIALLVICAFIAKEYWPTPGIPIALVVLVLGGRYWNSIRADPLILVREYDDLVTFRDGTKSIRPAMNWQAFFPLGWRAVRGTLLEGSTPQGYLWIWAILPIVFALASTAPIAERFLFSWPWFLGLLLSCSYWFDWLVVRLFLNFTLNSTTIYVVLPIQKLHRVCTVVYAAPLQGIARRTAEEKYFGCEDWNPDLDLITLGGGEAREKLIARWMPDDEFRQKALELKDAL